MKRWLFLCSLLFSLTGAASVTSTPPAISGYLVVYGFGTYNAAKYVTFLDPYVDYHTGDFKAVSNAAMVNGVVTPGKVLFTTNNGMTGTVVSVTSAFKPNQVLLSTGLLRVTEAGKSPTVMKFVVSSVRFTWGTIVTFATTA